ncbi:MAG TPA: hypothetical protein VGB76_17080 [Pyrinomonadaceae bacterium]|jgi:hypothetical protein
MNSSLRESRVAPLNSPRAFGFARRLHVLTLLLAILLGASHGAWAQKSEAQKSRARKLPSPDKIVSDYLKAVGGRKRQGTILDATYEWNVQQGADAAARGTARTYTKFPASTRTDIAIDGDESKAAANARSAWLRPAGSELRTLTDREANVAKLLSALDASRLVDYKKQDVLARTIELSEGGNNIERAYVIEFSRRNGAWLRYWFGVDSKLPLQVTDDSRELNIRYKDYRATQNGVLEPHRIEIRRRDAPPLAFTLNGVRYNTGLADALFEPPSDLSLNIAELLRAVASNQAQLDRRVSDYTYTRKETQREFDGKGLVKTEKVVVHEVYPVAGGGSVLKLISEDGVPLSPTQLEREEKRVVEELAKLERENARRREKRERERAERERKRKDAGASGEGATTEENVGVAVFLRACEFVSPRRERFQERDAIVFDFRPRPNFKPSTRSEAMVAKLAGVAWIDPVDRQVMRLEARLAESYKVGGGLFVSVRPGSAVVIEQTRLADGVWLPRYSQINAAAKLFLFAGFHLDATHEYSNYKRFSTVVGDAQVDAPPEPAATPPEKP